MAKWCGILDTAILRSHADFVEARFDSELQPDAECIARDMRLLADEVERLRAALRLYIARASCTPWPEITASDVQSAIDGAAELEVTPAEKGGA